MLNITITPYLLVCYVYVDCFPSCMTCRQTNAFF
ncbi:hypothetical protein LINPERPRIM_LOCUS5601 [Linum perenne]